MKGNAAMFAWAAQIPTSTAIHTGEAWTKESGWQGVLTLSPSGASLIMSPEAIRKLATKWDRGGGRLAGLHTVIDDMLQLADELKVKNDSGVLPPNIQ